nr:MAG TPA: hypothetical protein [Caudoviricetes sp.]
MTTKRNGKYFRFPRLQKKDGEGVWQKDHRAATKSIKFIKKIKSHLQHPLTFTVNRL